MPRVIFKCPYLKGGGAGAEHRRFYVKYIATREGVQKTDESRRLLLATKKQEETVRRLLREFPDAREMFEYEDYVKDPTRGNASEFITAAAEQNLHPADIRENYVNYIAVRPRAERTGAHGLFTAPGVPVVLEKIADEAAGHLGHIWTPVFSLRREDAARLGYDNAGSWQAFLSSYAADMAKHMKIQPDHFRWHAAYHDEGHHPHVHMVCWSSDSSEGFLTKDGIRKIKAGTAGRIFRQELTEIYKRQTLHRDSLAAAARGAMMRLAEDMQSGVLRNDNIERLMLHLAERLRFHSGRKQYGYLKAPLKAVINEIADELAKDARVQEAYKMWCETRLEVLRTYQKKPLHPGPLSAQKEFNHIRNIIIAEAEKLSRREFTFEPEPEDDGAAAGQREESDAGQAGEEMITDMAEEEAATEIDAEESHSGQTEKALTEPHSTDQDNPPPHVTWTINCRQAKKHLYGSENAPRDFAAALSLFTEEALAGNALAMHDLARMYAHGLGTEADPAVAHEWYAKALAAFMAAEDKKAGRYTQYRIGKMYAAGLGTDQDHGAAAGWLYKSAESGYKYGEYSLAGLYYHGRGVKQDYDAAFSLYSRSAAQGFPYADFELGKMHRDGIGTGMDTDASCMCFEKAFYGFLSLERQSRDDKLQYRLGRMLENGAGTEKDIPAATGFYEKAAGAGNPNAQYAWAKLTLKDENASSEQTAKAAAMMIKAADSGNGAAVCALAKMHRDGIAVEKDILRAVSLFKKAAEEHKNEYAAYALGKLYLAGEDVPKDADAALRWFTQAADQGSQYAQYALGKLYLTGKEVPRDKEAALRWFTLSADQGNIYARFFIDHFDRLRDPSAFLAASRLLHHMGGIFRDAAPPPPSGAGGITIDRKLLKKLRAKKISQGHASGDHAQAHTMQL